jgi:hypothetical protein
MLKPFFVPGFFLASFVFFCVARKRGAFFYFALRETKRTGQEE